MDAAERASSSSESSHSHSGMVGDEIEPERSQQFEISSTAHAEPPPKKKRTRTLTTPHQSAVLHALLAKSRFPTTAMREEVGRQIGLSARKVQVSVIQLTVPRVCRANYPNFSFFAILTPFSTWRRYGSKQKSRRPQGGSATGGESAHLSQPAQSASGSSSGSLPNTSTSAPSASSTFTPPRSSTNVSHSQPSPPPPLSLSSDVSLASGPSVSSVVPVARSGWPASSPSYQHRPPTSALEWEAAHFPSSSIQGLPTEVHLQPSHVSRPPHSQPSRESVVHGGTPGMTPRVPVILTTPLTRDASLSLQQAFELDDTDAGASLSGSRSTGRVLPPVNISSWDRPLQQSQQRNSHSPSSTSGGGPTGPNISAVRPFPSRTGPLASPSQLPVNVQGTGRSSGTVAAGSRLADIPAPFTLQPQPQWDPRAFTPQPRPNFSSWIGGPVSSSPSVSTSAYYPRPARQSFSSFGGFPSGERVGSERRALSPGPSPATSSSRAPGIGGGMHQHSLSVGAPIPSSSVPISRSFAVPGASGREQQRFHILSPTTPHSLPYRRQTTPNEGGKQG
ncbi:hypothetical protein F5J12DRAFT_895457 [Pisolithus orientalis]|uniref:uncharacterized protein n=1 Tax=Pisolithus orientalis TaxID=936130 RepID=UPI0022246DB9|nr:uncharacterized protein F5J12DRAFT_895457 [Pisolithus orientalis]KAI5998529.1 hypothetical protein F5J12DRAFT_895457 [Pisolithus orientalis]